MTYVTWPRWDAFVYLFAAAYFSIQLLKPKERRPRGAVTCDDPTPRNVQHAQCEVGAEAES